jgi:hypothetical protein
MRNTHLALFSKSHAAISTAGRRNRVPRGRSLRWAALAPWMQADKPVVLDRARSFERVVSTDFLTSLVYVVILENTG